MRQFEITTPVTEVSYDELSAGERQLVDQARQATYRSYAPYSHFKVGASILLDSGQVVTGSNQENAAYPSGTCAERTACYYAHSAYPEAKFRTIAIAARGTDDDWTAEPISPCGACRQALLEYETLAAGPVRVLLVGRDKIYAVPSVRALLPFAFSEFE